MVCSCCKGNGEVRRLVISSLLRVLHGEDERLRGAWGVCPVCGGGGVAKTQELRQE